MAKHLPYGAVADNNKKEFDVMMKWHLGNRPNGDIAQLYHDMVDDVQRDQRRSLRMSSSRSTQQQLASTADTSGSKRLHAPSSSSSPTVDPLGTTSGSALSEGTNVRRAHVRRKHRGNCPKHLMHEIQRSGGIVAPRTPTPEQGASAAAGGEDEGPRSESAPLPKLVVPNMIGRGLGEFLAGVRNPHYDKVSYVHRPNVEHPNFRTNAKALDDTVAREAPAYNPKNTSKLAPPWLIEDKLLAVDAVPDMKHYRKKYEMKTHMEAVRMMGKALLREFSGAAFK